MVLGGLGRRWEVMLDHWTILASAVWVVGWWLCLIVGQFWLLLRWFGWFQGVWGVDGWLCLRVGRFFPLLRRFGWF